MRSFLAAVLVAVTATTALAEPDPAARVAAIRDEAKALQLTQAVLAWYTRTVGEPAIQAETYKGHEGLFSKESVRLVGAAAEREKDPEQKRALGFLKVYLAGEFLGQKLSRYDDEVLNAEIAATVRLPWSKDPVPYKQLDVLMGTEKDGERRHAIDVAKAEVGKSTLNPILARKEAEAQRLARELGYKSYIALAEEFRRVDLRPLIVESERVRAATDATYQKLLAEVADRQLGVPVAKVRRSDVARLRKAPRFEKFFPSSLAVPAFTHFLEGIGLDLSTVDKTQIRIDDALHPQKEPRAACFNIRVPGDIRITVKPTDGLADFVTFFHEGGHALHYANTRSKIWEYQQLGAYDLTEGLAETFGHAWDDPVWLRRYRDFVKAWNASHKTNIPTMTDAEIAELVRVRVWDELYFIRRYGSAKLLYESVLHGGDPSLWQGVYKGPTSDLQVLYKDLFQRAYGFALDDNDALRFRTDVDDLLYAADYMRAFGLANTIHEGLRQRYGESWYTRKEVGAFLRDKLFTDGNRLNSDDVARLLGHERFDFRPSEARWNRLLSGK